MTASIPIKKFRESVDAAIKRYEKEIKSHGQKISDERSKDISNIKRIVISNSFDYYKPKKNLFRYLEKMKTGWTGNSNLKKFIKEEVKNVKKSCPEELITPMGQMPYLKSNVNKIYFNGWNFLTL